MIWRSTATATRAGNFSRSPEGLLITSEGYQVMPGITVPANATSVSIGTDGTVTAQIPGQNEGTNLGQIQVASFPNPTGLQSTGDNYLKETASSGAAGSIAQASRPSAVTSGS